MDDASVKRSKLLKDLMVATKRLVPASSSSQGTMSQGGKATTTKQTKPKKATFFKKPKDKADDKAQPITMTTDAAATSDFEAVERGAKAAKTLKELATVVQADLDDKQGRGWHVVAGKDFAVDIRYNWLTQQYGHTWHVVVSTGSRDLVGAVHANPGTLLDVVFAKALSTVSQTKKNPQHQQHVRFLVYQHGGFEASLDLITLLHRVCLVLAAMAGALFLFYRLSYRPECIENDTTCTDSDHVKAIAGDFGQFVATIVVVVLIGTASLLRVSRNAIRQKVKHV
ncbi:hypothetical protein DYB28_000413 [Aphanomyces astaci]|uniref:Transmembrane protein n=1 Tax=Aphanomyces astaci TaxID=112090 RepID=A0A9X8HBR5_APHAT|nr:hypothetical protein DYB28_000413 [Aphanomyces astaci]